MSRRAAVGDTFPDVTYLSIYCAEESHADKPWLVASFIRERMVDVGGPDWWAWRESDNYWCDHRPTVKLSGAAVGHLAEDRHVPMRGSNEKPSYAFELDRARYRFSCRTCGLTIERQAPAVLEVFERLAEAGILEVSLRALLAL